VSAPFKPEGYPTVSPYLIVEGASQILEFLARVFGAVEIQRFNGDDGRVLHAETRIDDSVIMLGDRPANYPATSAHLHIYVADVDATSQRALKAGATSVQEPMKKQDPDRRTSVRFGGDITWWIATKVE
jgi:PhnB protein